MRKSGPLGIPEVRLPRRVSIVALLVMVLLGFNPTVDTRAQPIQADSLIGYTELSTNLPGGRHANVVTMRAVVVKADGSAFPGSSGVNPMLTILALAHHTARGIAGR